MHEEKPYGVAGFIEAPLIDSSNRPAFKSGAADLDSEIAQNGGALGDCTNEMAEKASSGIYKLEYTVAEAKTPEALFLLKSSDADSNIILVKFANNIKVDCAVNQKSATSIEIHAGIRLNGTIITTPTSAAAEIYDAAGAGIESITTGEFSTPDSQGVFKYDWTTGVAEVSINTIAYIDFTFVVDSVSYTDRVFIKRK